MLPGRRSAPPFSPWQAAWLSALLRHPVLLDRPGLSEESSEELLRAIHFTPEEGHTVFQITANHQAPVAVLPPISLLGSSLRMRLSPPPSILLLRTRLFWAKSSLLTLLP